MGTARGDFGFGAEIQVNSNSKTNSNTNQPTPTATAADRVSAPRTIVAALDFLRTFSGKTARISCRYF
jgi:hypothetical protein